jgi:hypothetical protein
MTVAPDIIPSNRVKGLNSMPMAERDDARILLIEELNVRSFIYLLVFNKKNWMSFFIHFSSGMNYFCKIPFFLKLLEGKIKKIKFADLPGAYFAAEEEGYQNAVDSIFEKNKNNVYVKTSLDFCKDSLYLLALKKVFYLEYAQKRVKTFTVIKYLSNKFPNLPITFIPLDNEEIVSQLSDSFVTISSYTIPKSIIIINSLISAIKSGFFLVSFPFLLILIIGKFLFTRGLDCNSQLKKFNFALDNFNGGINFEKAYDFFLFYDYKKIHPAKTLQVIRNSLESSLNDQKTRDFFETNHYPYIEMDKITIPVTVFNSIICKNFIFGNAHSFLKHLFSTEWNSQYLFPSLSVMIMKIKAEIFYHQYDVKVFIARDEYSPFHIVRTLVARAHGNATIGFSHGDDYLPTSSTNYLVFDKFAVWGEFYQKIFINSLKYSDTIIVGAGVYGLDKTYNWQLKNKVPLRYKSIRENFKIIGIFASSFDSELYVTKELTIKFYKTVLDLTDQFEGYYRIIKAKGDEFDDPEFMELLKGHKNVIIEEKMWTYRLLPILDIIICINATSVGIEGLVAGKKVFYYDVTNNKDQHIYATYSDFLVAFDEEKLDRNLKRYFIGGQYLPQELIDKITRSHGYKFDGNVINRIRDSCMDLLREKNQNIYLISRTSQK